jgi:hypothetical protein
LLSDAMLAEATKGQPPGYEYGFGFTIFPWATKPYGHAGEFPGVNGVLLIYPEYGFVVVVLSNLDPPAAEDLAVYLHRSAPNL